MLNCRFCHEDEFDDAKLVKYGVRHYAHFACYLDRPAGGAINPFGVLTAFQVGRFPYSLLKERGLLDQVWAIIDADKRRRDRARAG